MPLRSTTRNGPRPKGPGDLRGAPMRSRVWKRLRVTSIAIGVALLTVVLASEAAHAICAPSSPISNAIVTCTDTTSNQNNPNGYGTITDNGNTITVTPGATLTGTGNGIVFRTGTVLNSGIITGGGGGINAVKAATVTNSGTISGGAVGVQAFTVTVTNSGTIAGGFIGGIDAFTATVANSGTISGGINVTSLIVSNSGNITGDSFGIGSFAANTVNVTNSGTISGGVGIGAALPSILVNSGAIIGTGGTAIDFSASSADNLTFLPGSRIQGAILLGAGDSVSVVSGPGVSSLLTFTPNGPFTLAGSGPAPFVVVGGNQIATLDPTPFGLADKNLMDFTRAVSGILGSLGSTSVPGGPLSSAFVPSERDTMAARVDDAFAAIQGPISALGYANDRAMVFKAPTTVASDGRAVWARGFAGRRTQDPDGPMLGAHTSFFGGTVGFDMVARGDLRLGLLAGGGESRLSVDQNAGSTNADTAFGGLYGRWGFVSFGRASFLDFALHGGGATNATSRTLTSNVAPFVQVATARYDGAYVSPELKYGIDLPLWSQYTLTPSLGLRYVAGFFGGYTEAGSVANLTVASRTIQDLEERGELRLTRAQTVGPDLLLTSVHVGAIGLQRAGDTTVNTVLLGANLPFVTPGKNDVAGIVGGGGFEWRTREGVSLFGSAEAIGFSDQSTVWNARAGLRVAF